MTGAIFLDRDGTLVDDPGFLRRPGDVRLLDGVAAALGRLRDAGYRLAVVTNQSGIARGLMSSADVAAVHAEIARQLAATGVVIDAWAYCPHLPDAGCACRKPRTALHRRLADTRGYRLAQSWCIGDRIGDVAAAAPLGARAVLVETGEGRHHVAAARAAAIATVASLSAAAELILAADR